MGLTEKVRVNTPGVEPGRTFPMLEPWTHLPPSSLYYPA